MERCICHSIIEELKTLRTRIKIFLEKYETNKDTRSFYIKDLSDVVEMIMEIDIELERLQEVCNKSVGCKQSKDIDDDWRLPCRRCGYDNN